MERKVPNKALVMRLLIHTMHQFTKDEFEIGKSFLESKKNIKDTYKYFIFNKE